MKKRKKKLDWGDFAARVQKLHESGQWWDPERQGPPPTRRH
jgi:hypothetical protein